MKIAIIGGGSSYTPELMEGLMARAAALGIDEVALHDVDGKRLGIVAGFVHRMAGAEGSPFKISDTLDPAAAVAGADFIITQIRVGGNAARKEDELLGRRHGLVGQETTGVGGFGKALRTVPAMLDLCGVIEEHAPDAVLINFTNPSGLVTEAVLKHTRVRAIGLCNIPVTFHLEMAKALGAKRDEVEFEYVGLNHLSWVHGVRLRGEDVTDRVLGWAGRADRPANIEELDYPGEFIRALGMIPMHYLRYYYLTGRMIREEAEKEKTRAMEVMEIESELMKIYQDPRASQKPEMLSRRGGANYSLAALELIEGICCDRGDVQVLDVQNHGALPGLPDDVVIEARCRVGQAGATPLPMPPPGPAIMGLVRAVKAYEELAVDAAVKADRELALLALAAHPLGPDVDHAGEVLADMISTHGLNLK